MKKLLRSTTALAATVGLMQFVSVAMLNAQQSQAPSLVTGQPFGNSLRDSEVSKHFIAPESWNREHISELVENLRRQVKYVFIIFKENHSFDNEYGTFPGVNGIYSDGKNPRSPANTPGFTQTYQDVNGHTVTVQ